MFLVIWFFIIAIINLSLEIADKYRAEQLRAKCLDLILENYDTFTQRGEYKSLPENLIHEIEQYRRAKTEIVGMCRIC